MFPHFLEAELKSFILLGERAGTKERNFFFERCHLVVNLTYNTALLTTNNRNKNNHNIC
jgi:hypothetical protein